MSRSEPPRTESVADLPEPDRTSRLAVLSRTFGHCLTNATDGDLYRIFHHLTAFPGLENSLVASYIRQILQERSKVSRVGGRHDPGKVS